MVVRSAHPLTRPLAVGLSKKDARTREQKKKAEAGIKARPALRSPPLICTSIRKLTSVVKKAAKAQIQCTVCKAMFIASMPVILRDHANKHPKQTPQECFPGATIAA
ncbi:hypothetical protein JCM1841_004945 [Sporobolomyces salmonicolor]